MCVYAKSLHSCLTLCDPMDLRLPDSSIHGSLQARTLEYVAISSPGDLPGPEIEPLSLMSPTLAGRILTTSTTWKAQYTNYKFINIYLFIYLYMFLYVCVHVKFSHNSESQVSLS